MAEHDLPLPALTTSSVFAIRSSISIDAPKQKVWDILLDFASYQEWSVSLQFTFTTTIDDQAVVAAHRNPYMCGSFFLRLVRVLSEPRN